MQKHRQLFVKINQLPTHTFNLKQKAPDDLYFESDQCWNNAYSSGYLCGVS